MNVTALKISVIDDDASVLRAVGRLLQGAGFAVRTFASAEAFLECGTQMDPDCLVLDVHLGGLSGLDLEARLAAAGRSIPISSSPPATSPRPRGRRRGRDRGVAAKAVRRPVADRRHPPGGPPQLRPRCVRARPRFPHHQGGSHARGSMVCRGAMGGAGSGGSDREPGSRRGSRRDAQEDQGFQHDHPRLSRGLPALLLHRRDGKPAGYSVELCSRVAASIAKELALPSSRSSGSRYAADRIQAVVNGTVDLECGSTTASLSRQEQVDFSLMTFVDGGSLLVTDASASGDLHAGWQARGDHSRYDDGAHPRPRRSRGAA